MPEWIVTAPLRLFASTYPSPRPSPARGEGVFEASVANVAWMERSGIRGSQDFAIKIPDSAALHPGY